MAPQNAFRVELVDPGNGNQRVQWVGAADGSIERFNSEPLASWWRILLSRVLAALIPEERL